MVAGAPTALSIDHTLRASSPEHAVRGPASTSKVPEVVAGASAEYLFRKRRRPGAGIHLKTREVVAGTLPRSEERRDSGDIRRAARFTSGLALHPAPVTAAGQRLHFGEGDQAVVAGNGVLERAGGRGKIDCPLR